MRSALVVLTFAVFTALLAAPANAATRTYTLRYGPVAMGGFNVKFPKVAGAGARTSTAMSSA